MSSSEGISPPPLKQRRLFPAQIQPPAPPISHIPPLPSTSQSSLRIYSWNINDITLFLSGQTTKITSFLKATSQINPPPRQPSLRACLRRWQWPHIVGLQEVKIAPTDTKTPVAVRRAVNAPLDSEDEADKNRYLYEAYFCLPRDKYNATGFGRKMYGVCTLIRQDVKNVEMKTVDWDLEGRVLLAEIPHEGVAIVNVYAVNGTINDYRDPSTGEVVGDRHDRKRVFHSLLRDEVKRYKDNGWQVIVGGDINISRTRIDSFPQQRMGEEHVKNRADFEEKLIKGLGMIDTFRLVHGEERKFTYRPRNKPWGAGGDRVDMVMVTTGLKDAVREANILDTEEDRGPSDHVPLCLEIEFTKAEDRRVLGDNDERKALPLVISDDLNLHSCSERGA